MRKPKTHLRVRGQVVECGDVEEEPSASSGELADARADALELLQGNAHRPSHQRLAAVVDSTEVVEETVVAALSIQQLVGVLADVVGQLLEHRLILLLSQWAHLGLLLLA